MFITAATYFGLEGRAAPSVCSSASHRESGIGMIQVGTKATRAKAGVHPEWLRTMEKQIGNQRTVKKRPVDEFGCYKIITYMHLLPEDDDDATEGKFPVDISDIAIGMISGRADFYNLSHSTVLRFAQRGVLIRAMGMCPCSFRAGFRALKAAHPHAKWYYMGDDDAIINLWMLARVLSKFDHKVPTIIGSNGGHRICHDCGACPSIFTHRGLKSELAFYGGTGQILSAPMLETLSQVLSNSCQEAEKPTLGGLGDLENTCSMARFWHHSFRFVQLNRTRINFTSFLEEKPTFITAHHLCPRNLERLAHTNSLLAVAHETPKVVPNSENDGCGGGGARVIRT